jgi:hypothetical protein
MNRRVLTLPAVAALVSFFAPGWMGGVGVRRSAGVVSEALAAPRAFPASDHGPAWNHVESRRQDDVAAMRTLRPGYAFWRAVFTIPDGSVAFGSALDGRPLAVFPATGDWTRKGKWIEAGLAAQLDDKQLPSSLDARREYVAQLLQEVVGPVLHNVTRGRFVSPGAERYGSFFKDWGAIYERFGVPAEIGLAQALVESGFQGARRSEAGAVGLCQWLEGNWKYLDRIDPNTLEAHNQTTQAAYCAAYLSVLGTKYGSFIPALSEHHAGGTNVGRILVNGQRLGGEHPRERYFLGANFARDLRAIGDGRYSDVYQSYGPRSYRYAEMIFGNAQTVGSILDATEQARIHAMRTSRSVALSDISRRTGLSADEIKRFNPALVTSVPAGATLYLPAYDAAFGRDVSFWHRPATDAYAAVLNDFVRQDASPEEWEAPSFRADLTDFARRFRATGTEEGSVMATMLTYVEADTFSSGRRGILSAFKTSDEIRSLFNRGVLERETAEALRGE